MHDLESFFWVLFWICINYEAPGEQAKPKTIYDAWNYIAGDALANLKAGLISDEGPFMDQLRAACTEYYKPLIPQSSCQQATAEGIPRWESAARA